ncbi:MAG: 50S ribosomal protein L17, partial [Puniceicoccales bacterium]|nr:50S ribosomal protein L17 [Puniceicoccales bacterium]
VAGLAAALLRHGKIRTTLVKAKALRPFTEKVITLACKASRTNVPEQKLHYRRMAVARVRDQTAVKRLFDELVEQFLERPGGYTRIYKLVPRKGDAAKMAIIELLSADDEGHGKSRRARRKRVLRAQKDHVRNETSGDIVQSTVADGRTEGNANIDQVSQEELTAEKDA